MKKKIVIGVFANPGTVIVKGTKYRDGYGGSYRTKTKTIVGECGHSYVRFYEVIDKRCPFTRFAGEIAFGILFLLSCGIVFLFWRFF